MRLVIVWLDKRIRGLRIKSLFTYLWKDCSSFWVLNILSQWNCCFLSKRKSSICILICFWFIELIVERCSGCYGAKKQRSLVQDSWNLGSWVYWCAKALDFWLNDSLCLYFMIYFQEGFLFFYFLLFLLFSLVKENGRVVTLLSLLIPLDFTLSAARGLL